MLGNFLAGAGATVLLLAAGLAVALTWRPPVEKDPRPLDHLLLTVGWGFGLVPYIAFMVPLLAKRPMTAPVVLAAALAVLAVALILWFRAGRVIPVQLHRGWKKTLPVLLACIAVGALYTLRYDRSLFSDSCCLVNFVYDALHLTEVPDDLMLSEQDDQRLGNTAVISAFAALYGNLGFRLLFGLSALCAALGGFVLGRRTLGSDAWGWLVLGVLTLNPYLLRLPLIDENLLTLGVSSLALPLLFRRGIPWVHVGLLLGLALMMRHALVLSLPAVGWVLWRQPRGGRLRSLIRVAVAFTAVTWVAHVHHALAYGSVFTFESYGQIPDVQHRFIGAYSGLLQWPFAEQVIRTPWNPFPTFLMWPVYLAAHFGLVLFAAMLVGCVALALQRGERDAGVFWLLWFAPTYAALSLQEHWGVPNKMGVIYILMLPLALWAAVGLRAAWRAPLRWGAALLAVMLLAGGALLALRGLDVPPDRRYREVWPGGRPEDPGYVAEERQRITRPRPWPQFGRAAVFSPVLDPRVFGALADDLRHPDLTGPQAPYGWRPADAVDPNGRPVTLTFDLREQPSRHLAPWVVVDTDAEPDVDLAAAGPPRAITGLEVGWVDRPVTILTSPGRAGVTTVLLVFESVYGEDDSARLLDHYDRALRLILGWEPQDYRDVEVVRHQGETVTIRALPGPISAVETLNNAGHTFLQWRGVAGAEGEPLQSPPKIVFHN